MPVLRILEEVRREHLDELNRHAADRAAESIRQAVEKGAPYHWSATPLFWVAVATFIAAAIAAWPVVRDWLK